jgi:Ca2+-binding RTX toxin-like protein
LRVEDVGSRSAVGGRLAPALLVCLLAALAPAAAHADAQISVASAMPANVVAGAAGLTGSVVVHNANTAPDGSTTICSAGVLACGGADAITLLPSCSATSGTTCSAAGADPGVFSIGSPAAGSGTGCAGRSFAVSTGFDAFGTVRFTPAGGALVMPFGSSCTITFTFAVNRLPVDAQTGVPGLQTRQRVVTAAVSDTGEYAPSTGGSGTVSVALPAPSVTDTDPDSPADDNAPEVKGTAGAVADHVTVYPAASCAGVGVSGSVAAFTSGGITVGVGSDTTTVFTATVSDTGGGVSACSTVTSTYVEDSTPPPAPVLTDTDPDSPSSSNTPRVKGAAAPDSTVRIYTSPSCQGAAVASGTDGELASPGLLVSPALPSDGMTALYATATDIAGNASSCSAALIYVEDSTPPAAPVPSGTSPLSPANDNTPHVKGTAAPLTSVLLYTSSQCTGSPVGAGSAATFASQGIAATIADNTTTTFYATATDAAGNVSPCSAGTTYVEDSTPPASVVLTGSSPASPSSQNSLRVTGTAPPGTSVRLYTDAACASTPAGAGSAADLASPGIAVSVPDDATTRFYARSVDAAGNVSGCSETVVTYVEDSAAPETSIDGGPAGTGAPATPAFTFTSTDPSVAFECRIDGGDWVVCTSPFTTPALGAGPHTFEVRARDSAGNVDGSSAVRTFTVGGTIAPPPPPSTLTPPRAQPGCAGVKGSVYVGTAARNSRTGVKGTDVMFGLGGNDTLRGAGGLDCLYGGAGNDVLRGDSGADRLFGEAGNDRLDGLSGNDRLSGAGGGDRLNGGAGDDRLTAGAGRDTLVDHRGSDRFSAGTGDDRIDARDTTAADRRKRDRILCGAGIDRVLADPIDIVARDCEKSHLTRRSLPASGAR